MIIAIVDALDINDKGLSIVPCHFHATILPTDHVRCGNGFKSMNFEFLQYSS